MHKQFAETSLRHWQSHKGTSTHPVIFGALDSISDANKVSEGVDILVAGSDTTASTLTAGLMRILSHPAIHTKLVEVIDAAMPVGGGILPLQELEKIDYLVRPHSPSKHRV